MGEGGDRGHLAGAVFVRVAFKRQVDRKIIFCPTADNGFIALAHGLTLELPSQLRSRLGI